MRYGNQKNPPFADSLTLAFSCAPNYFNFATRPNRVGVSNPHAATAQAQPPSLFDNGQQQLNN